ncbi:TetR/AcrR family transcriptional regulator [Nocardia jejuensis]|uniref:TetR/AcrR family transcriptional regulator n=1 Tax=Nocardia jejuensis TaxID=328049 RepID=UPI00082CE28D|nr:TetR/AcrR family transcriptional regulator [Nocardia jejuensis]
MPRLTPATAQQRRTRIIDAAMECFGEFGLHGTTMQDICSRAVLSPGSVYSWFPSKEAIIDAVARERHQQERTLLERALTAPDPRTALHTFLNAYFDWLADPAERQRRRVSVQVWAASLVDDHLRPSVQEGIAQRTLALDAVRAGQAAGAISNGIDADAITRLILALIQGFILQQAWEPDVNIESYRRAAGLVIDAIAPETPSTTA